MPTGDGFIGRDRRARLWLAVGLLPILIVAAVRLGALLALLSCALAGVLLFLLLGPTVRRARSATALDRFEDGLFDGQAAASADVLLSIGRGRCRTDPRPWARRVLSGGMVQGRLVVTGDVISFVANDGGDCFAWERGRAQVSRMSVDGDGYRAALTLRFIDGTAMRILTVNPRALAAALGC